MSIDNYGSNEFVLKATCQAARGIVALVTSFLSSKKCYISELHQFDDEESGQLFMRVVCRIESDNISIDEICQDFPTVANQFDINWKIYNKANTELLPGSGVDLDKFQLNPLSIKNDKFVFLLISRLLKDKGIL